MSARHAFVSDVHLVPGGGENTDRFVRFLNSMEGQVDVLHVLGDLFHFWLGRGHEALPDYAGVIEAFRSLRDSGIEINLIWGNRDFLVRGSGFEKHAGVSIRGDEHCVTLDSQRVKLVHGDLLCANDVRYQRFRRVIRSWPVMLLERVLPLWLKRKVAEWLRRMSEREVKRKTAMTMDLDEVAVRQLFADGTDVVVCGHIHKEQMRELKLDGRTGRLFVLGAWEGEAPYLMGDEQGQLTFARGD